MYDQHPSARRAPAFRPSRFLPGLIVGLAFLATACTDASTTTSSPSATSTPSSTPILSLSAPPSSTASGFTVLANAAVTCTNGTITGDVGTFLATPTGSVTQTTCPVVGTVQVGTQSAAAAFNAFLMTYAGLTPQPNDVCSQLTGTLDGVTLAPGVYCFASAAALTGVVTLQGPATGTWVFKVGTGSTGALTGTSFSVVMAGGAQACNVTWWVAQAVTMTTSAFEGNLLAGAAITFTGGSFNGNAWSKADVTITGTAVTGCAGAIAGNGHDKDHDNDHANGHDKDHDKDHANGHDRDHDKDHANGHDKDNDKGHANGHDDDHGNGHDSDRD